MKVIFVKSLGSVKPGTEKDVSEGYALNFLFPKGIAIRSTPEALAHAQTQAHKQKEQTNTALTRAQGQAASIAGKVVEVQAASASTGTLYSAVSPEMVASALQVRYGIIVPAENVHIVGHAKTIGAHQIKITLHPEVIVPMVLMISKLSS